MADWRDEYHQPREHAGLDTLDWNRLRSGYRRALNPANQPLFDQFYATASQGEKGDNK